MPGGKAGLQLQRPIRRQGRIGVHRHYSSLLVLMLGLTDILNSVALLVHSPGTYSSLTLRLRCGLLAEAVYPRIGGISVRMREVSRMPSNISTKGGQTISEFVPYIQIGCCIYNAASVVMNDSTTRWFSALLHARISSLGSRTLLRPHDGTREAMLWLRAR